MGSIIGSTLLWPSCTRPYLLKQVFNQNCWRANDRERERDCAEILLDKKPSIFVLHVLKGGVESGPRGKGGRLADRFVLAPEDAYAITEA